MTNYQLNMFDKAIQDAGFSGGEYARILALILLKADVYEDAMAMLEACKAGVPIFDVIA